MISEKELRDYKDMGSPKVFNGREIYLETTRKPIENDDLSTETEGGNLDYED